MNICDTASNNEVGVVVVEAEEAVAGAQSNKDDENGENDRR